MEELEIQQLKLFEDLLTQSKKGLHLAFDNETIVDILSSPLEEESYFTVKKMKKAQDLLTAFLEKESLSQKRNFTSQISNDELELLIRTYFHLVESSIKQSDQYSH